MNEDIDPTRFTAVAATGLRAFPGKPRSKEPALLWKKYQQEAPTEDELAQWDSSEFNVCIVTGSASNIVVLDVDSPEAQAMVDDLNLPPTPTVRTARGCHLYFKHPGYHVPNGVKLGGLKLDLRGDGGYVIGPGSIHPSGVRYEWIVSPAEIAFALFPKQLAALLSTKKNAQSITGGSSDSIELVSTGIEGLDKYLTDELGKAQREIAAVTEGNRNTTLFKMSARMARHISAAEIEWCSYADALASSARAAGLEEGEILSTLESGWNKGSAEPTLWIRVAREHVYLSYQERFYHLPSGKDLKPSGFNGQFGNFYWSNGTFSNFLLLNDCVRKVFDLTYDPLNSRRIIPRDGIEWLNTFKPSGIDPVEGDPAAFLDFMAGLVPDDMERDHLLRMIAFTVRNPGLKLRYALLLRTAVQGVGKSMLIDIWGALLGRHNVRKTTSKELSSDYQGYLPGHLLVVCEELNLGMGAKTYNDLKDMITADTALVNEKHLRQRQWPVFATFVFLSNLPLPILVEETDRRIFYIDSPAQRRAPTYYNDFVAWWQAHLGVIRNHLDSIDLSEFNAHENPPVTASKLNLIAGSRSELAQDLALAIRERQGCFDRDIVTLEQVGFELGQWARTKTKVQLTKALKEVGALPLGQQRVTNGRASLWVIRNVDYWALADTAVRAEELQQQVGIFAGLDGTGIELAHIYEWPADPTFLFLPNPDPMSV